MAVKIYLLYCDRCNFKKLTDGSDLANLIEVKTCSSCSGGRRFKCPKCGYLMKATKARQDTEDEALKEKRKVQQMQEDTLRARDKERKKLLRDKYQKETNTDTSLGKDPIL